jgi:hypothetical protein
MSCRCAVRRAHERNGICWTPLASIRREEFEMSPTYYVVHRAKLETELETARRAGDLPRMQVALAGLTGLNRAMYGHPAA